MSLIERLLYINYNKLGSQGEEKNGKRKYVLADKSKFDHRKFHKFADLEEVTIVSYDAPENYEKYANILIVKDKEEA